MNTTTPPTAAKISTRLLLFLSLLIVGTTLFRFWYSTQLGLVGDEAYYWVCSKHLDWSFFDKGPGAAATIFLGTHLFGDTIFGIRFFAVLLSAATGILLFLLGRRLFDDRTGFWSVIIALLMPLFAVGSILMTIDPLSVFFWALAALLFWEGAKEQGGRQLLLWSATGVAVGLGMLSKYTNLMELLCFILFLGLEKEKRPLLRSPAFFSMIGVSILFFLPMIIWNAHHGAIGLIHLIRRGDLNSSWGIHPSEPLTFLGAQLGVISPFFFLGILLAVFGPYQVAGHRRANLFLKTLFIPLFLFYFILSLNKAAEPNWVAPCYIAGMILLAANWPALCERFPWMRKLLLLGLLIAAFETVLLHNTFWLHLPTPATSLEQTSSPQTELTTTTAPTPGTSLAKPPTKNENLPGFLNYLSPHYLLNQFFQTYQNIGKVDPIDRTRGNRSIAAQTAALAKQRGADFIISDNYQSASLLSFYLPGHPPTYTTATPFIKDQYSIWPSYWDHFSKGSSAIFAYPQKNLPQEIYPQFEKITFLGSAPVTTGTQKKRTLSEYYYYLCEGLKERPKSQEPSLLKNQG